ncbi:MAG: hypothetical protein IJ416_04870 [Ruminiclostridium sp.]|nr:hypothetical protein [Ruminiclostridium sp.]
MENTNINVQRIMADIKAEIERKNLKSDILSFEDVFAGGSTASGSDFNEKSFVNELSYLNSNFSIASNREIKTGKKVIGGLVIFVKKVIRKMTRFYVEPIVTEQNAFNTHTVRALNCIRKFINSSTAKQKELIDIQIWYNKKAMPLFNEVSETVSLLSEENRLLKSQVEELTKRQEINAAVIEKNNVEIELLKAKLEKLSAEMVRK